MKPLPPLGLVSCALLAIAACRSSHGARAGSPAASAEATATVTAGGVQKASVQVTQDGFVPAEVRLVQGKPAVIELTRTTDSECLSAVRMPWLTEPVPLPQGKPVAIAVDTHEAGTVRYSCWMGMVFGTITVVPR